MLFDWLKRNKGTPLFKVIVLLLILFVLRVGFVIFNNINSNNVDNTSGERENTNVIERILNPPENEDGEKEPLFDIHIGWSNVVVFTGLAIALAVIERRKDKSTEEQPMMKRKSENNDNDDEEI